VRVLGHNCFQFGEPAPQTVVLTSPRAAGRSRTIELRLPVIELRPQTVNHLLLVMRGGRSTQSRCPESLLEEADDGCRATPVSIVDGAWRESHQASCVAGQTAPGASGGDFDSGEKWEGEGAALTFICLI
jgi:hypothetical protein